MLHPGPCSSVGMRRGTDRQTHRRPWPIYISPRLCLTRNVTRHRASTSMYSLTFRVNCKSANSAQLGGIPYHSPKLHLGPCNNVGMRPWADTQTSTNSFYTTVKLCFCQCSIKNNLLTYLLTYLQTDRHTDARDQNTIRLGCASRET